MVSLRKKKPATAVVPFSPEAVFQGEPSLQTVKIDMLLQVLALFVEPMWKKYQPILSLMGIRETPEALIRVILLPQNEALLKSSIDSVCSIMKAAADDQVTRQDYEEILLSGIEVIRVVNSTKVEEVPA